MSLIDRRAASACSDSLDQVIELKVRGRAHAVSIGDIAVKSRDSPQPIPGAEARSFDRTSRSPHPWCPRRRHRAPPPSAGWCRSARRAWGRRASRCPSASICAQAATRPQSPGDIPVSNSGRSGKLDAHDVGAARRATARASAAAAMRARRGSATAASLRERPDHIDGGQRNRASRTCGPAAAESPARRARR